MYKRQVSRCSLNSTIILLLCTCLFQAGKTNVIGYWEGSGVGPSPSQEGSQNQSNRMEVQERMLSRRYEDVIHRMCWGQGTNSGHRVLPEVMSTGDHRRCSGIYSPVHVPTSMPTVFVWSLGLENSQFLRFRSVSYTHLTLPTIHVLCRSRWSPYH